MSVAPQTSGNALAARSSLHLGSGGYGLLLGCVGVGVGVGAVAGALLLPRLRTLLRAGGQLSAGSLVLAAVALVLVLALVHVVAVVAVALAVGGLAWVLALSTLSSAYQLTLPGWVKARGMSFYLIAFQGGNAVGSAVLGVLAQHAGLTATFVTAAVALALGPLLGLRFPFQAIPPDELRPAGDWPAPPAPSDTAQPAGPVMVSVEYRPRAGQRGAMLAALRDTRFSRRRTGATSWRLWQDAADPGRIVEQFVVASWDEHLRQHDRVTHRDVGRLEQVRVLTDPDHLPVVTHWLTPGPDRTSAAP
jgi:MFS family permease